MSHRKASQAGLKRFVDDSAALLISSVVMDDANMWVQRESSSVVTSAAERRGEIEAPSIKRRKGRNVHVPCLNAVQLVFGRSTVGVPLHAAALTTPTQVLARANWSTVRQRLLQWSLADWHPGRRLAAREDYY